MAKSLPVGSEAATEDSKGPDNEAAANVLFHPPAAHEEHSADSGSKEAEEDHAARLESAAAAKATAPVEAVEPEPVRRDPVEDGDDTASSVVAPGEDA